MRISDWSSDVCSSDLTAGTNRPAGKRQFRNHIFMATTANPTRDDFAAMLEQTLGGTDSFEGHVVKGTVTGIENDLAVIDVGLKREGRVPLREFAAPGQKADLKDRKGGGAGMRGSVRVAPGGRP